MAIIEVINSHKIRIGKLNFEFVSFAFALSTANDESKKSEVISIIRIYISGCDLSSKAGWKVAWPNGPTSSRCWVLRTQHVSAQTYLINNEWSARISFVFDNDKRIEWGPYTPTRWTCARTFHYTIMMRQIMKHRLRRSSILVCVTQSCNGLNSSRKQTTFRRVNSHYQSYYIISLQCGHYVSDRSEVDCTRLEYVSIHSCADKIRDESEIVRYMTWSMRNEFSILKRVLIWYFRKLCVEMVTQSNCQGMLLSSRGWNRGYNVTRI